MTAVLATLGLVVLAIPFIFGIAIAAVAWRSWWLYPAWGWFIVPLGVPAIGFWHFAALLLFVDTVKHVSDGKKDDRPTDWSALAMAFLWPIAAWALLRWMR